MFEERFIAFVDIIGFKEIVKNAKDNEEYQKRISGVLNYIAKIKNDNYHGKWAQYGINNDVSVFSDSIVISYPCDRDYDGLFHLLMDLIYLCFTLIQNDIYIRGGITVGEVIHDQNISWGPAFVEAYKLEEENAIYPRIIIDKKAIDKGKELYAQEFPYDKDGDDLDKLMLLDADGAYYLDYLSQWEEFDYLEDYLKWLNYVRNITIENLNSDFCPRIKMKYVWFARYYNLVVSKLPFADSCELIDIES